jgi:hypothetical protein
MILRFGFVSVISFDQRLNDWPNCPASHGMSELTCLVKLRPGNRPDHPHTQPVLRRREGPVVQTSLG